MPVTRSALASVAARSTCSRCAASRRARSAEPHARARGSARPSRGRCRAARWKVTLPQPLDAARPAAPCGPRRRRSGRRRAGRRARARSRAGRASGPSPACWRRRRSAGSSFAVGRRDREVALVPLHLRRRAPRAAGRGSSASKLPTTATGSSTSQVTWSSSSSSSRSSPPASRGALRPPPRSTRLAPLGGIRRSRAPSRSASHVLGRRRRSRSRGARKRWPVVVPPAVARRAKRHRHDLRRRSSATIQCTGPREGLLHVAPAHALAPGDARGSPPASTSGSTSARGPALLLHRAPPGTRPWACCRALQLLDRHAQPSAAKFCAALVGLPSASKAAFAGGPISSRVTSGWRLGDAARPAAPAAAACRRSPASPCASAGGVEPLGDEPLQVLERGRDERRGDLLGADLEQQVAGHG